MLKSDFYFDLPQELIAQTPVEPRNSSRMLILDKNNGEVTHGKFTDLYNELKTR